MLLKQKSKIFTLIELLVVIAIIGILASMLLPTLKNARDMGKMLSCVNNQKQFSLIFSMYTGDNDGWWIYEAPNDVSALKNWPQILIQNNYAKEGNHWNDIDLHCPSRIHVPKGTAWDDCEHDPFVDYLLNGVSAVWGGGLCGAVSEHGGCKNSQIKAPSSFATLGERCDRNPKEKNETLIDATGHFPGLSANPFLHPNMHIKFSNYLFADGHVKSINYQDISFRMWQLNYVGWCSDAKPTIY
jgi:prepilin-type N-terminal cleavage/methylation domain-containing protein/prepilin-type processing-associated H-X9-DG protein